MLLEAEAEALGVTRVERKAVRRAEECTVTGTSSRMLEGMSLLSMRLMRGEVRSISQILMKHGSQY